MIDLHNHILPDCDDGAKTFEESIEMLRLAEKQGVTDVVNTIHYQHPKMIDRDTSYEHVFSVKQKLQDQLIEQKIKVNIHLGAEVFFDFNLLDILNNELTTFCNNNYMLIEFQTFMFPPGYQEHLYELSSLGITPIIAHPERYRPIQNDIQIVENLINSGCLMQIDAGSIIGHFGEKTKNTSIDMLKNRMVHIMGSDAHNNRKRNFCLPEAILKTKKIIGDDVDVLVNQNPMNVLTGKKIIAPEVEIIGKNKKNKKWHNFFR